MLQVRSSPLGRSQLQIFHPTFQARMVVKIVCIVITCGNEGHKAVKSNGRICGGRSLKECSARNIDCDFSSLSAVGKCCTHPINCRGTANFHKDGHRGITGNDYIGITECDGNRDISIITVNDVRTRRANILQKAFPPNIRIPSIPLVSQPHIKVKIFTSAFCTNTKRDIANTTSIPIFHAAFGKRNCAGCTLIGSRIK